MTDKQKLGFFKADSAEEYHAHDGIGSSSFRKFLISPAHFKTPTEDSKAFRLGRAVHNAVLLGQMPLVGPDVKLNTKEGKALWAEYEAKHPGKEGEILRYDEGQDALGMVNSLRRHPEVVKAYRDGIVEESIYVKCPRTGLMLKARPDIRTGALPWDLKKSRSLVSPKEFAKTVFNYKYHIQAAWYLYVLNIAGVEAKNFKFIAIEDKAPYACAVYQLDDEAINIGDQIIQDNLDMLAHCMKANQFPGYPTDTMLLSLPQYAISEHNALMEDVA